MVKISGGVPGGWHGGMLPGASAPFQFQFDAKGEKDIDGEIAQYITSTKGPFAIVTEAIVENLDLESSKDPEGTGETGRESGQLDEYKSQVSAARDEVAALEKQRDSLLAEMAQLKSANGNGQSGASDGSGTTPPNTPTQPDGTDSGGGSAPDGQTSPDGTAPDDKPKRQRKASLD